MRYSPHAAVAHQSTNLQIMANFHELIEGFHNFREEYLLKETEFFEELKHGQNPHTLVIACCDSRVDPAIILGCRVSKTQQLSNWEADELTPAQKMYAATDAWICREMYMKLLKSEKNPLTPEQLAPNSQQNDKDNTEKRP